MRCERPCDDWMSVCARNRTLALPDSAGICSSRVSMFAAILCIVSSSCCFKTVPTESPSPLGPPYLSVARVLFFGTDMQESHPR
jgi:hypothetical protein